MTVSTLQMLDSKNDAPNPRTDTDRYQEQPKPIGQAPNGAPVVIDDNLEIPF